MNAIRNFTPDVEANEREFEALFQEVGQYLNDHMKRLPLHFQVHRMKTIKQRIADGKEPVTHPAADQVVKVDLDYIYRNMDITTLHQLTTSHMSRGHANQLNALIGSVRQWRKDDRQPKAFILSSPFYGVGKTHIATAVADSYMDIFTGAGEFAIVNGEPNWHVNKRSVIVTSKELMQAMSKPDYDHDKLIGAARCLVIDEIGREGSLQFEKREPELQQLEKQNLYFELINYLSVRKDVALFITSNLTIEQLKTHFNGATWSRLKMMTNGYMFEIIDQWPDYRGVK